MGLVYADITLKNTNDVGNAKHGIVPKEDVRQLDVKVLVDTGAIVLTINDEIATKMGLDVQYQVDVELADGTRSKADIVGPIDIHFENRMTNCSALVLPGATEVLLGAVPMQKMDVVVDPKLEQLTVHPDRPFCAMLKVK
jgi:clan AA aspartic protease